MSRGFLMSKRKRAGRRCGGRNLHNASGLLPSEREAERSRSVAWLWEALEPRMFLSQSPMGIPSQVKGVAWGAESWGGPQWAPAGAASHLSNENAGAGNNILGGNSDSLQGRRNYAMLDSSLAPVMDPRFATGLNDQPPLGTNAPSRPTDMWTIADYTIAPATFAVIPISSASWGGGLSMLDNNAIQKVDAVQNYPPVAQEYIAVVTGFDLPYRPANGDGTNFLGSISRGAAASGDRGGFDTRGILPAVPTLGAASFPRASMKDLFTIDVGDSSTIRSLPATDLGVAFVNKLATYPSEAQSETSYLISTMPSSRPMIEALAASASVVEAGTTLTLVASGVTDTLGSITAVTFYLETGNMTGDDSQSEVEIGEGVQSGATWTLSTSTDGFPPGVFTYTAIATDNTGAKSERKTTTVTVARAGHRVVGDRSRSDHHRHERHAFSGERRATSRDDLPGCVLSGTQWHRGPPIGGQHFPRQGDQKRRDVEPQHRHRSTHSRSIHLLCDRHRRGREYQP